MSFFRTLIKDLPAMTTVASDGLSSSEFDGYVNTGSYALNAALSGSLFGGMPNNKITVFGGSQMRPNLQIQDMCDLYMMMLEVPDAPIAGQIFNVGHQNMRIADIDDREGLAFACGIVFAVLFNAFFL